VALFGLPFLAFGALRLIEINKEMEWDGYRKMVYTRIIHQL